MSGDARAVRLTLLGDSCSGKPGTRHEQNLAKLSDLVLREDRPADALLYLGDHIEGYTSKETDLEAQWDHFLGHEFRAIRECFPHALHIAGNHDAYDVLSAAVCERRMPIPAGARGRTSLNYVADIDGAEIVCLRTTDILNHGRAQADLDWLEVALARLTAPVRIVAGHHPVFPVNGFADAPMWAFPKESAEAMWRLFKGHGVQAYLCSHIIAFDFQVHDDIVQLTSGGAGTEQPPDGVMGDGEYRHYVACEISPQRFWFEAIDEDGRVRESKAHDYGAR